MSISADMFTPRWASAPGATVQDVLHERRMTSADLADLIDLPQPTVDALLDGRLPITDDLAHALAQKVGSTVQFWLAREAQYRADLSRVEADAWATRLPVQNMVQMGWIPKPRDWKSRLTECLHFFGISDVRNWAESSRPTLQSAYFRYAQTATADPNTVLAWLRQGEIVTSRQSVERWDPSSFSEQLPTMRALTRQKDPAKFVPALADFCTQHGVRFAVVRAPQGCPVSGVARYIDDTKPTIVLSARHLTDDHFWFTFFHEAGHLLLHNSHEIYLDDDEQLGQGTKDSAENEANRFAQNIIVPGGHGLARSRWRSHKDIVRRAQQLGIGPGVLVGQLQHEGALPYDTMNGLKRRYKWNNANLEMA
jgi:HTH-type transcriptional regulator/antitoxin HigA